MFFVLCQPVKRHTNVSYAVCIKLLLEKVALVFRVNNRCFNTMFPKTFSHLGNSDLRTT